MRKMMIAAAMAISMGGPIHAAVPADSPDLPIRFVNAIPDICFQTARGHPPTADNAATLLLEPTNDVPPTVAAHFRRVPSWFRLKSEPNSIFVGVGDRPNACHIVLANSRQTKAVQSKVLGILRIGGFQTVQSSAPAAPLTDVLLYKEAPDGLMFISVQAPADTVGDGVGEQGAVHVSLISKVLLQSLTSKP